MYIMIHHEHIIHNTSGTYCKILHSTHISLSGSLSVSQHLDQGTQLLRAGSLGEALNHYHAAVGLCNLSVIFLH